MNAVRKFTVLCLMLLLASLTYASIYSNDAFVLVDVSGTMKDSQTNMEARSIIQEILLGEFDYSKWQTKGWSKTKSNGVIPSEVILKQGSHFCIIPFGNISTVHNYTGQVFQNVDDFKSFYSSYYPTTFSDEWTYLTLAKAYVGSIAFTYNIKAAYVFIYTDGIPESTKKPYGEFDQHIVDDWDYEGCNSAKKISILRKNSNNDRHYDIELWEFTSYPTEILDTTDTTKGRTGWPPPPPPPPSYIKIDFPTDGKSKANPHKVDNGQELTLRWSGGAGSVNVYTKEGNNYKLIPPNKRNEFYTQTVNGTTAKLTFSESTDYKIEVRGTNGGSDAMFLSVTTPILPILLKLLLIIGLIVGGVYAYNKFFRPGPKYGYDEDNDWKGNNRTRPTDSHASSGNDDW